MAKRYSEAALAVECPGCKAPAGVKCVTGTGRTSFTPHGARVKAAEVLEATMAAQAAANAEAEQAEAEQAEAEAEQAEAEAEQAESEAYAALRAAEAGYDSPDHCDNCGEPKDFDFLWEQANGEHHCSSCVDGGPEPEPEPGPEPGPVYADEEKLAKVRSRVEKLIAQAEGTDNAEEAATFMAAAEELMVRYAIERAQLEDIGVLTKEAVDEFSVTYAGRGFAKHFWRALGRDGAAIIVRAIGLTGIAVNPYRQTIVLFGPKTDCDYVSKTLLSVWKQAYAAFKVWKATNPEYLLLCAMDDRKARYEMELSYFVGYCWGVAQKIEDRRNAVVAETGSELVLAGRQKEIEDFMGGRVQRSSGSRAIRAGGSGFFAGEADGAQALLEDAVTA